MNFIDRAFSVHDDALVLRSQRSSLLAANIANADTPDYKARDLEFDEVLAGMTQSDNTRLSLRQTDDRHLPAGDAASQPEVLFRQPLHPALDGNTVEMATEQAHFSRNAVEYQTSLTFMNSKVRGLLFAIKGQ